MDNYNISASICLKNAKSMGFTFLELKKCN
jgi:hypothetical protein